MKKIATMLVIAVFSIAFISVGVITAADCTDAPENITIDTKGYSSDKKGPVELSHKKHTDEYGAACTDCHHVFEDGKNTWKEGDPVQKCSECHDLEESKGKIKKLQLAYHKNCKDCHKDAAKEGKENAPYRKCNDCHK